MPAPTGDTTGLGMNVPRSLALWKLYGGPAAIIRRGDWIDRASLVTPIDYALLGFTLDQALRTQGDTATAARTRATTLGVVHAARMESMFGIPAPR